MLKNEERFDGKEFKSRVQTSSGVLATSLLPPLDRSQYERQTGVHGHRPPHELGGSGARWFLCSAVRLVAVVAGSLCTPVQDAMGW
jgi:hypothetical protein